MTTDPPQPLGPPPGRAPRSRWPVTVPARLKIVGWIVLTTLLGLVVLTLTVRTALVSDVGRAANADVVQELEEFGEFVGEGRDPTTAQPFTSTAALLEVYLRRQRPSPGELLIGYLRETGEVITTPITDADEARTADVADRDELIRSIVTSAARSGITPSARGDVRWGRVDLVTDQPGDSGGALVVVELTEPGVAAVGHTIRLIAGLGAGALLLVSGIAWVVAGQILRPVRTVRQAAAELTERDLTRRIPVQGRDDVSALASTFNSMLDRLDQAFRTQRRFLDDAGHELRTPITIVYGHLELLSADPDEHAHTIPLVLDELERMSRIVNDLLVLATAERPDFVQPVDVDVASLTLEIDAKVQVLGNRRWTLAHVADGLAHVDPQRVTQAVLQLAQNAVQHSPDGTDITIGSAFVAHEPVVEFTVRDHGPGVPPSEVATIFQRFTHGSSSARPGGRPGAGLGLAIVRAIAEGHGGTAFVRSVPGDGATFGIRLPVAPASGSRRLPAERPTMMERAVGTARRPTASTVVPAAREDRR